MKSSLKALHWKPRTNSPPPPSHLPLRPNLVGIKQKTERREATRESKALRSARLEKSIEAELLSRLKSGAYGDAPLNVNEEVWKEVLESRANAAKKSKGKGKKGGKGGDGEEGIRLEDEESEEDEEDELEEMEREVEEMENGDWDEEDGEEMEWDQESGVGEREFVSDDDESEDEEGDIEELYDSVSRFESLT